MTGVSLFIRALALALLLGASTAWAGSATDSVVQLLEKMNSRLEIAADVAKAKWNSGAPIEDPLREAQILERVATTARGLSPAFARAFFRAQIDAGKLVQKELHRRWKAAGQPPFSTPPDLAKDIRPRLDQLTPELLAALNDARPALSGTEIRAHLAAQAATLLNAEGVTEAARQAAIAPLID